MNPSHASNSTGKRGQTISAHQPDTIENLRIRFERLFGHWGRIKDGLIGWAHSRGLATDFEGRNDGNEVHFRLFAINCYLSWRHDFEHGVIEYGVLILEEKRPVTFLPFQIDGTIDGKWQTTERDQLVALHDAVFSQYLPRLARAYMGPFPDFTSPSRSNH